jgi:hypothetical protein
VASESLPESTINRYDYDCCSNNHNSMLPLDVGVPPTMLVLPVLLALSSLRRRFSNIDDDKSGILSGTWYVLYTNS